MWKLKKKICFVNVNINLKLLIYKYSGNDVGHAPPGAARQCGC